MPTTRWRRRAREADRVVASRPCRELQHSQHSHPHGRDPPDPEPETAPGPGGQEAAVPAGPAGAVLRVADSHRPVDGGGGHQFLEAHAVLYPRLESGAVGGPEELRLGAAAAVADRP